MNDHDSKREINKNRIPGFPCELFQLRDAAEAEVVHFKSIKDFQAWIERELDSLEARFEPNMTMNSRRHDFKSSR